MIAWAEVISPADACNSTDWSVTQSCVATSSNVVCVVACDSSTQRSYTKKALRLYVRERPVVVGPVWLENRKRAMRQAMNKIDQQMDSMQFLRPPRRCGRGKKPRSKWGLDR